MGAYRSRRQVARGGAYRSGGEALGDPHRVRGTSLTRSCPPLPPLRTTVGSYAWAYRRVLGGSWFLVPAMG